MAHLNYIRGIDYQNNISLPQFLPAIFTNNSFSAFCGTSWQRSQIGLFAMGRCCARRGVILLHNTPQLENTLNRIYDFYPNLRTSQGFSMYLANPNGTPTSYYDPLYGLSEEEILNCILPFHQQDYSGTAYSVRSNLSGYLQIMRYQYQKNPAPFGSSPYNLDLLLDLTRMSYSDLEKTVLNYLPQAQRIDLTGRLSRPGAQQSVFDAVYSFSASLGTFLWNYKGFASHSRLNIIQAAKNRQFISVYVPESRPEILDYLAVELQSLINHQIPFLCVESGILLNNSKRLKQIFFNDHSDLNYSTGILADNTNGILSSPDELASLLNQHQETVLFSCGNADIARPFSNLMGTYLRHVHEYHTDRHRQPFHLFSSHGRGTVIHEQQQENISPEELTSLGDGCILMGTNFAYPVYTQHFIF